MPQTARRPGVLPKGLTPLSKPQKAISSGLEYIFRFQAVLHPIPFLSPFGVIEAFQTSDKLTRYPAYTLKGNSFPDHAVRRIMRLFAIYGHEPSHPFSSIKYCVQFPCPIAFGAQGQAPGTPRACSRNFSRLKKCLFFHNDETYPM